MKPIDANEFYARLFDLLPDAQIETDNDGQVIVYTGLQESEERGAGGVPVSLMPFCDET